MTVKELIELTGATDMTLDSPKDTEVTCGYTCDLLSWVMAHGAPGMAWVTVQTHLNVIAVAVLSEMACVILPESIEMEQESLDKADADAAEADKLLAQYKAKLAAATAKAEEIQKNAEKRAAEFREAEEQKVKADIEQMKKSAQADIERDRAKAVEKLRTEMVALSMAAASKIIAKNMDSAENEALIAEFVDKLDKDKIGDLPC